MTAGLLVALPLVFPTTARPSGEMPPSERPVGALSFVAVLQNYQAFVDEPVGSWVEANAMVGRLGGWRSYAQEVYRKEQVGVGKQDAEQGADSPASREHPVPGREASP